MWSSSPWPWTRGGNCKEQAVQTDQVSHRLLQLVDLVFLGPGPQVLDGEDCQVPLELACIPSRARGGIKALLGELGGNGTLQDFLEQFGCGREHSECQLVTKDIKGLRQRSAAASELLEEIEGEALEISRLLSAKTSYRLQLRQHMGWNPLCDDDPDVEEGAPQHCCRSVLLQRLEESEEELRELRDQLNNAWRRSDVQAKYAGTLAQEAESRSVQQKVSRAEELQNRASVAMIHQSAGPAGLVSVMFRGWARHIRTRGMVCRMLARTTLALANAVTSGALEVCLGCWKARTLTTKRRRAARRGALAYRFATKFVVEADYAIRRGLLLEWWKLAKHAATQRAVQRLLDEIEAGRMLAEQASKAAESLSERVDLADAPLVEDDGHERRSARVSGRDVIYRSDQAHDEKAPEAKKPSRCRCTVM